MFIGWAPLTGKLKLHAKCKTFIERVGDLSVARKNYTYATITKARRVGCRTCLHNKYDLVTGVFVCVGSLEKCRGVMCVSKVRIFLIE